LIDAYFESRSATVGTDIAIPNRMRCQRIGGQATNQQCRRETSASRPAQEGSPGRRFQLTASLVGVSDGSCRDRWFVSVPDLSLCCEYRTAGTQNF
jgi:hypothetical protein